MKKKKRILMLHQGADLYGSDKVFAQTINILTEYFDLWVVLDSSGPLLDQIKLPRDRIIIHNIAVLRRKNFKLNFLLLWLIAFVKAIVNLNRIIESKNIDIVYSNTSAVVVGAFAAIIKLKPHIWHIHEIIERPKFVKKFYKFIIPNLSYKVITVSKAVKNYLLQNNYKYENKVIVIHNGFDWSIFLNPKSRQSEIKFNKDKIIIGYFGRLHFWKGQDVLLDAINILQRNFREFVTIFVGDVFPGYEDILDELRGRVKRYSLQKNVKFLGFRNDVPYLMSLCDIIVIPSKLPDPFPTTVLEAMASGKAVVGSNLGGIPEVIIDGKNGLLFKPNDFNELALKLNLLISNQELRKQLGINARNYVIEKFSLNNYKRNLLKVFSL